MHARSVKNDRANELYEKIGGRTLKFRSAWFDGNNYAFVTEYKISEEYFGIRCYFPKFSIVSKYCDIKLSKSRALIGSLVKIEMPNYPGVIEVSHSFAKKLDRLSGGKLGYRNV